jgi:hypothetical protein
MGVTDGKKPSDPYLYVQIKYLEISKAYDNSTQMIIFASFRPSLAIMEIQADPFLVFPF